MALLTEIRGERVRLLSNRSAPPGAPLVLVDCDEWSFEARTRGCRRHAPGFMLEARLVNLSTRARARLEALMNPPGAPDSDPTKGP